MTRFRKFRLIIVNILILMMIFQPVAYAMNSSNYSITNLKENYGSGNRSSTNYQIVTDIILRQPIGISASTNYQLTGKGVSASEQMQSAVYINNNEPLTNNESVVLNLACSDPAAVLKSPYPIMVPPGPHQSLTPHLNHGYLPLTMAYAMCM